MDRKSPKARGGRAPVKSRPAAAIQLSDVGADPVQLELFNPKPDRRRKEWRDD